MPRLVDTTMTDAFLTGRSSNFLSFLRVGVDRGLFPSAHLVLQSGRLCSLPLDLVSVDRRVRVSRARRRGVVTATRRADTHLPLPVCRVENYNDALRGCHR
jgi:hypothetical protein